MAGIEEMAARASLSTMLDGAAVAEPGEVMLHISTKNLNIRYFTQELVRSNYEELISNRFLKN